MNLQGKVISVEGSMVTIMPKHEDLKVYNLFLYHSVCTSIPDQSKMLVVCW